MKFLCHDAIIWSTKKTFVAGKISDLYGSTNVFSNSYWPESLNIYETVDTTKNTEKQMQSNNKNKKKLKVKLDAIEKSQFK